MTENCKPYFNLKTCCIVNNSKSVLDKTVNGDTLVALMYEDNADNGFWLILKIIIRMKSAKMAVLIQMDTVRNVSGGC